MTLDKPSSEGMIFHAYEKDRAPVADQGAIP